MERLRILAAAAALRSFTASKLAAFAGANENTVRSVLRRDREFFRVSGTDCVGGGLTGRPEHHYVVRHMGKLTAELKVLEETLGLAQTAVMPAETDDDRLAALVVAESSALRALEAAEPDRSLLLETARLSLRQSYQDGRQPNEGRTRRATILAALLAAHGWAVDGSAQSA